MVIGRHFIHQWGLSQITRQNNDDQQDQHRPDVDLFHLGAELLSTIVAMLTTFSQCRASIAASISAMRNGWPLTLVSDLRVDQELVAKHGLELAHVHLGHEDMLEALE